MLLLISLFSGLEFVYWSSSFLPHDNFYNCAWNPLLGKTYLSRKLLFDASFGESVWTHWLSNRIWRWGRQLQWWRFDSHPQCSAPKHLYVFAPTRWSRRWSWSTGRYRSSPYLLREGRGISVCLWPHGLVPLLLLLKLWHQFYALRCQIATPERSLRLGSL
jgi:hypothetical protein